MIISKTPLRMSFVGGGSDLPAFYRKYGGAVVSTAINKYIYVTINPKFDHWTRVSYSKTEEVENVHDVEHQLVRESLRYLDIKGGIEITTIADIPSKGTGLGSSSSFTVGLLHALYAFKGRYKSAKELADESCIIEIDVCKEPIGKQDQYVAAFGGFNLIKFNIDDTVDVDPIICKRETMMTLQDNIIIFYTGMTRSASTLLKQQVEDINSSEKKRQCLQKMVQLSYDLYEELQKNNLDVFGEILHENWMLKKDLTQGVSNPEIDNWYDHARKAGALGGKILGAGAGGFLMLYAPKERHENIIKVLKELRKVDIAFDREGSKIIFFQ